jgi:hypothetical protein
VNDIKKITAEARRDGGDEDATSAGRCSEPP